MLGRWGRVSPSRGGLDRNGTVYGAYVDVTCPPHAGDWIETIIFLPTPAEVLSPSRGGLDRNMNDPQQRKDFLSPHAGNRIEKLKSIAE